jgi:hypothetical protein
VWAREQQAVSRTALVRQGQKCSFLVLFLDKLRPPSGRPFQLFCIVVELDDSPSVVAESRPETRSLTRLAAKQALAAMMELVRDRKVMRYRRRWIASLDLPT